MRLSAILLAINDFIQIFYCAQLAQFVHSHFLGLRWRVLLLCFRYTWLLYLHCNQAVCTLALALHPALSLPLRMQEEQALIDVLSSFILRIARKSTLDRVVRLPGLTSPTLSRAGRPSRPRIVFYSPAFHQRKLVNVKQESGAFVDELVSLVILQIGVVGNDVIHVVFLVISQSGTYPMIYVLCLGLE